MAFNRRINILFTLALVGSLGVLYFLYGFFNSETVIKGGYIPIGLLLAILIINMSDYGYEGHSKTSVIKLSWCWKGVIILIGLSITILIIFQQITPVLVFLIPFAYALLILQYVITREVTNIHLAQLVGLFSVISYAKIAATDFYFGNLDLINHTNYTTIIVQTGDISQIRANYSEFPGLHTLSATVSLVTTIPANDVLSLVGLFSFSALLVATYLFIRSFTGLSNLSFISVLLLSVSARYVFFSNYSYPQSFGITLFFYLILLASIKWRIRKTGVIISSILISIALVVSHHFIFILMAPILTLLFITKYIGTVTSKNIGHAITSWTLLGIPYLAAGIYWVTMDFGRHFILALVSNATNFLASLLVSDDPIGSKGSGPKGGDILIDTTLPQETLSDAVNWLYSIKGIHEIILIFLLSIGISSVLMEKYRAKQAGPLLVVGLIGSLLILENPLSAASFQRIIFPFSIFAFVIAGFGVHRLLTEARVKRAIPVIFICCIFVSVGPLLAADDVKNWSNDTHNRQVAASESELRQFEATSAFIDQNELGSVSTFLTMRLLFSSHEASVTDDITVNNGTINSDYPIIYNEKWPRYRVRYNDKGDLKYIRMSDKWLRSYISSSNKVYDTGQIGLLQTRGVHERH